ncbi:hypothetical protein RchiOBHm_Chr2g0102481 [Rosa chinensis]|uniref:Uncharacterized protein n=1 Tax=Rosa chinensis TaxID=74649 RepID=A0A2P6RMS3_ROSCH|nr:hypothetical protein RchiOBHm_Chr2g0102481 [Rosa chinensis]
MMMMGFTFSSFRSAANHNQSNRGIKPKEVTNIGILLRALNVARDEVVEALSDGK